MKLKQRIKNDQEPAIANLPGQVVLAPSFFALVTEKLMAQPEFLAVARANCARWLSEGHSAPQRLREWDGLLSSAEQGDAGRERLREVLLGANEADARLRDFHPFAGILTREERRKARELCGYRH